MGYSPLTVCIPTLCQACSNRPPGPTPRVPNSISLGRSLSICLSNKFPGGVDAAGSQPYFEDHTLHFEERNYHLSEAIHYHRKVKLKDALPQWLIVMGAGRKHEVISLNRQQRISIMVYWIIVLVPVSSVQDSVYCWQSDGHLIILFLICG